MQTTDKVIGVTVIAAAICAALAFLVPIPGNWLDSGALYYSVLSLTFGFVVLHIGAVVLFFMGIRAYKKELRRAYVILCISILALAIGTLQLPVISALNLWDSGWATSGAVGMPFIVAEMTAYFGARNLAKLIGLKGILVKPLIFLPLLALSSTLAALLPHVQTGTPEAAYNVSITILAWGTMIYLSAAILALQVKRHIGAHYTTAMAWLFLGLLASSVAILFAFLDSLFSTKNQDAWSVAMNIAALVSGTVYLKAGAVFVKTKEY